MKTKMQRVIMFVPYVNLSLIFVWLYYYIKNPNQTSRTLIVKYFIGGTIACLIHVPRILLSLVIDNNAINMALLHISIYVSSLFLCSIAINDQIKQQENSK